MGNVFGMCLPLGGSGKQEKKLKAIDLENYATLAINLFVKLFKKIRWRVELEEFYL